MWLCVRGGRILYMRILTRKLMACIFKQDAEFIKNFIKNFIVHQEWI